MSIFNIFKRPKYTQQIDTVLQASATLYPNKILIKTVDRVKEGFGISSTNVSTLPVEIDNNTLGLTIRHHLNLTRTGLTMPKDYKKHYQDFLDKAGFKNGKEHHKNALHLTISQRQDKITLSPTNNGGYTGKDRGFVSIKDSNIVLTADIDNVTLGDKIKEGWSKCECNCI
ncbi:MAG: contact-dependent growth inhibition system immunity protein [Bacteroidia bacterium]